MEQPPSSPERKEELRIYGATPGEWHARLAAIDRTETPDNPFGTTSDERAWWAIAALAVFEHLDTEDDAPASALAAKFLHLAREDDETLWYIITDHAPLIPDEIFKHLSIGGDV